MFQKYSRSGTRFFGSFDGKYTRNWQSFCIMGQNFTTDNSSKSGTLTLLTSFSFSNYFFSVNTSFRKSLLIMYSGGRYSCTIKKEVNTPPPTYDCV